MTTSNQRSQQQIVDEFKLMFEWMFTIILFFGYTLSTRAFIPAMHGLNATDLEPVSGRAILLQWCLSSIIAGFSAGLLLLPLRRSIERFDCDPNPLVYFHEENFEEKCGQMILFLFVIPWKILNLTWGVLFETSKLLSGAPDSRIRRLFRSSLNNCATWIRDLINPPMGDIWVKAQSGIKKAKSFTKDPNLSEDTRQNFTEIIRLFEKLKQDVKKNEKDINNMRKNSYNLKIIDDWSRCYRHDLERSLRETNQEMKSIINNKVSEAKAEMELSELRKSLDYLNDEKQASIEAYRESYNEHEEH